jgi:hypothetical protein
MDKNPTFAPARFPLYLTERQLSLLREIAKERGVAVTECMRNSVHDFLKKMGRDDGLLFTYEEMVDATWKSLNKG